MGSTRNKGLLGSLPQALSVVKLNHFYVLSLQTKSASRAARCFFDMFSSLQQYQHVLGGCGVLRGLDRAILLAIDFRKPRFFKTRKTILFFKFIDIEYSVQVCTHANRPAAMLPALTFFFICRIAPVVVFSIAWLNINTNIDMSVKGQTICIEQDEAAGFSV